MVSVLSVMVIIGVLGFVGWRVYANNKTSQSTTENTTNAQPNKTTTTQYATIDAGTKITLSYPNDWQFAKTATATYRALYDPSGQYAGETSDNATVTSPDDSVVIKVDSGISGIGGACLPEDSPTMSGYQAAVLRKSDTFSFVSYRASGGAGYLASVVKSTDAAKGGNGRSVCELAFASMIPNEKGAYRIQIISAELLKKQAENQPATQTDIDELFANPAYKQAQDIITQSMQIQ